MKDLLALQDMHNAEVRKDREKEDFAESDWW